MLEKSPSLRDTDRVYQSWEESYCRARSLAEKEAGEMGVHCSHRGF